ncbi:MAG: ATP-binding protein [Bdellovibrionales bacterium]
MLFSLLLAICVLSYLGLASYVFTEDKKQLVFDYTRTNVKNFSGEIDRMLRSVEDKLQLISFEDSSLKSKKWYKNLVGNRSNIAFIGKSENFNSISKGLYFDPSYFDPSSQSLSNELFKNLQMPWKDISENKTFIWKTDSEFQFIGLSRVVLVKDPSGKVINNHVVFALLKPESFLSSIDLNQQNSYVILDSKFNPLIFSKNDKTISSYSELLKNRVTENYQLSVFEFIETDKSYMAALTKTFNQQIFVLSYVDQSILFSVIPRFIYRSLLFAIIVVTTSFIVAILFSSHLVKPLRELLMATKEVAKGNLDSKIDISTKDETSVLAQSFNDMIKDLKMSRDELEELNLDLENKVKDRTEQLEKQNIAVKEAQEALIQSSRLAAAGEIAGRAAHEVLNPLTSINTRLQLMHQKIGSQFSKETELLEDIQSAWSEDYKSGWDTIVSNWKEKSQLHPDKNLFEEDLGNIKEVKKNLCEHFDKLNSDTLFLIEEGRRIEKIVQSMRKLNRPNQNLEIIDLRENFSRSQRVMQDLADKEAIDIVNLISENCFSMVDSEEMVQVFTNLLRNSIHALKSVSDAKITIRSKQLNGHWQIEFHDNGSGIPEMYKSKLFESNFTTKTVEEGTGLGLSICRRLIRSYQGDISLVNSSTAEGTSFLIKLPAINKEEDVA